MASTNELLDRAVLLIDQHLLQLRIDSTTPTKDGSLKGLTQYDSQVIERYTKLLLAMTKKDTAPNEFDNLTDEELEAQLNGITNEQDLSAETGD